MQALELGLKGILDAVAASNSAAAGHVLTKGRAEFVVRGVGWLGSSEKAGDTSFDADRAVKDLEMIPLATRENGTVRLAEVARVQVAPGFRRGVLEKDGNEVAGGVVLMARGENPLEVTRRLKAKIREIQTGLAGGCEDRPLLRSLAADSGRDRHGHRHGASRP